MNRYIFFPILTTLFCITCLQAQLSVYDMVCEYKKDPLGIDVLNPRLSWKLNSHDDQQNVIQQSYQIQVANNEKDLLNEKALMWNSGIIESDQSIHVKYEGIDLNARSECFWRVKVWDNHGRESDWSQTAKWEIGLLDSTDWKAEWIEANFVEKEKEANPAQYYRKTFTVKSKPAKARLYITSHGLYESYLNGKLTSNDVFTPGWTSYNKRLQHQVYDLTNHIQEGENQIGVILGDGWYRGEFGWTNNWNIYGDKLGLLYQLELEYSNGQKEIIASDDSWKVNTGPIIHSSIYDGEKYDARLELDGWNIKSFDDSQWDKVVEKKHNKSHIIGSNGVPILRMDTIEPLAILTSPKGETIIDMGQNMVGRIRFELKGDKGDSIKIYHAEVLDKDGNFYTANLRNADQLVHYVFKGSGKEVYEPNFTFQGFRYIKIEDYKGSLSKDDFKGIVIFSNMDKTGSFMCSDTLLNQLQSNIEWGQKGNFLDVPTDCPQRDERMGWTGDAQAFAPTACYNFNTAAFYTKWLGDLSADQKENGSVPWVIPSVLSGNGAIGWADAATIIPWTMYLKYGDIGILENQYESMKGWVDFLKELAGENLLVQDGFHFGDWLFFIHPSDWNAKPGYTDIDLLGTAFLAHSAEIVSKSAEILGKNEDAENYQNLYKEVKKSFHQEFLTPNGRLSPNSQTAYTLALKFGLIPESLKEKAVFYLTDNIKRRNYHLSTGFLGTPHLNHVLTENGHVDIAYQLLLRREYPSWLYPVTRGATTIWERWDGIKPDGSFQNVGMNSFNHYAYGAIGDWMYSVMAGIQHDEQNPAYKHFYIAPILNDEIEYVEGNLECMYGEISSVWKKEGNSVKYTITIPPNTKCTVRIPGKETITMGSGTYEFNMPVVKD